MHRFALPVAIAIPRCSSVLGSGVTRRPLPRPSIAHHRSRFRTRRSHPPIRQIPARFHPLRMPVIEIECRVVDRFDRKYHRENQAGLTHFNSPPRLRDFQQTRESIDTSNVRDVLGSFKRCPSPKKKSILNFRFLSRAGRNSSPRGRRLRAGASRGESNWALNSAVSGWAEHDAAAARHGSSQLPPARFANKAMQTGRCRIGRLKIRRTRSRFWTPAPRLATARVSTGPIFSRWMTTDRQPRPSAPRKCRRARIAIPRGKWSRQLGEPGSGSGLCVGE